MYNILCWHFKAPFFQHHSYYKTGTIFITQRQDLLVPLSKNWQHSVSQHFFIFTLQKTFQLFQELLFFLSLLLLLFNGFVTCLQLIKSSNFLLDYLPSSHTSKCQFCSHSAETFFFIHQSLRLPLIFLFSPVILYPEHDLFLPLPLLHPFLPSSHTSKYILPVF